MTELATYLLWAFIRRDWSLYQFDKPIILYREPKDTIFELMMVHSHFLLRELESEHGVTE